MLAVGNKFARCFGVVAEHTDQLAEGLLGHNKTERSQIGNGLLPHCQTVTIHRHHIKHTVARLKQKTCQDGLVLLGRCRKARLLDHGTQQRLRNADLLGRIHDRQIREFLCAHRSDAAGRVVAGELCCHVLTDLKCDRVAGHSPRHIAEQTGIHHEREAVMALRLDACADADLQIIAGEDDRTVRHLDADALQCRYRRFLGYGSGYVRDRIAKLIFITCKLHDYLLLPSCIRRSFRFPQLRVKQRDCAWNLIYIQKEKI